MLSNAFFKSLRDQARPLIMWVIGVAFYVALLISIYPSIRHSAASLQGYIDSLPATIRAAFLGSGGDFSSPVGYVNVELLSWLAPIVFIAFAVSIAARALAGEEESGTLSLLLTQTVDRRRLVLQKYAAMTVTVAILGVAFWLALFLATRVAGTPVSAGELADAMLRLTLLGLAVGSVTYAVERRHRAPADRHRRRRRGGPGHVPAEHPVPDERKCQALPLPFAVSLLGRRLAARAGLRRRGSGGAGGDLGGPARGHGGVVRASRRASVGRRKVKPSAVRLGRALSGWAERYRAGPGAII